MEKGNELQKRYMILNLLGEGGEGRTYLAYDGQQNRNVVVKELKEAPTEKRLAAWRKLIGLGKVQGIVQLFDVFEEEQMFYMILEHVAGKNGMDYLGAYEKGLPPELALKLLKPVIKGVALLHENGLLHRDISTDNLIVTEQENIVLCDLSLVCENEEGGVLDSVSKVKNGFSPLEMYQANGRQGTWSDVYGLCATMYHFMTGRLLASPANRSEEDDPFEGISIRIPEAADSLIHAGLQLNWEYRLDNLQPFCRIFEQTGGQEQGMAQNPAPYVEREPQKPYIAPPEMRTMPVNVQEVRSFQPDNAMTAKQKNMQGSGKKMLIAVGIVCVLLAVFAAGFGYYRVMNDEDTEKTADSGKKGKDKDKDDEDDEDSDKKSEDSGISLDELMEMYAEYMEDNSDILYIHTGVDDFKANSYKLVCIDDDALPECFISYSLHNWIGGILYYNKITEECEFVSFYNNSVYGEEVLYAEKENSFCVESASIGGNYFCQFDDNGKVAFVGHSKAFIPGKGYEYYDIGNRTNVKKSEYEEYNADFGFDEMKDSITYDNMYVSMDKAYEKFLDE